MWLCAGQGRTEEACVGFLGVNQLLKGQDKHEEGIMAPVRTAGPSETSLSNLISLNVSTSHPAVPAFMRGPYLPCQAPQTKALSSWMPSTLLFSCFSLWALDSSLVLFSKAAGREWGLTCWAPWGGLCCLSLQRWDEKRAVDKGLGI